MNESAPQGEPCPRGKDKPESSCKNRQQCWEPCGELGHNMASARVVTPHEAAQMLRAAAPQAAPSVAGWKLVPLEPTQAMIDAFHGEDGDSACNKWDAMLSASPPCPSVAATEREAFEAWALAEGWDFIPGRERYPSLSLKSAWSAWQARAALPLPAVVQASQGDVHPAAPSSPSALRAAPRSELRALGQGELPVRPSHARGPWRYQEGADAYTHIIRADSAPGGMVCHLPQDSTGRSEANARRIVQCVNAHDDMLKALRRAVVALAFAAESSPAMRDDYEAVSATLRAAMSAPGGGGRA